MAEPRKRGKRRVTRSVFLVGALLPILLTGLFLAFSASAATAAPGVPAGHAATMASTATMASSAPAAQGATGGGPCSIPGIGDLGSLLDLCNAGSGVVGTINNICSPGAPQPEQAAAGLDSMIDVPGGTMGGKTLYDNYGVAGQNWNAYGLTCSDMTSLIGNDVANMVFNFAKSLDRLTITVYQSAASNGILSWLSGPIDNLISKLGAAIYFPFLAPVVILGAIWLAWQGLVRKRATRTIEGTVWMVIACTAAIWLIGRPGDFTNISTNVSNSVTGVMNVAFAKLPAPAGGNCLPGTNDPATPTGNFSYASGNGLVDQNANELWSALVCKPWLQGEFGTTVYATSANQRQTIVNQYGGDLLWAQTIAANEQPTTQLITNKQNVYQGIAQSIHSQYPADYALFQGNQWTTRVEIGFSALIAAVVAGLLVLLIALTLILLKLGFMLLLVAGPFFLIVGTHPGFGRVIAIRWFEMLVGILLKQIAVALTLSVLLYCYSLIMGTTDTALPWALKIIMIALVTVAVFIYRKPFSHLFSAVGYGMLGSSDRAEVSMRESTFGFRRATAGAAAATAGVVGGMAGAAMPGVGGIRGARWSRRFGESAGDTTTNGAAAGAAAAAAGGSRGSAAADAASGRQRPETLPGGGSGGTGEAAGSGAAGGSNGRGRHWPDAGYGGGRAAPPLPLPGSGGGSGSGSGGGSAGWARTSSARTSTSTGPIPSTGQASASRGSGARPATSGAARPAPRPTPPPVPPPTPSPWAGPFRRGK
ncbi:MAG TPA: type IV secretion system protein [Trebonia sp.]